MRATPGPAGPGIAPARGSATATPRGGSSATRRPGRGSARWRSRRPGRTSGSARHHGGHLQATGRDARGRKQYRYHAALASAPRRGQVRSHARLRRGPASDPASLRRDLAQRGLPREQGARRRRPTARADADPRRQRRVRPPQPLLRADDAARPARRRRGRRDPLPVPRQVRAVSTRSGCAIAGSRRSCAAARSCRARSCSSTWTTTAPCSDVGSDDVNAYLREAVGRRLHGQGLPDLGGDRARLSGAARVAARGRRRPASGPARRGRGHPRTRPAGWATRPRSPGAATSIRPSSRRTSTGRSAGRSSRPPRSRSRRPGGRPRPRRRPSSDCCASGAARRAPGRPRRTRGGQAAS